MKMEEIHVPVYDNSPSIEQILRPISYTSWFMGVGIARPRKYPKIVTIIIRIVRLAVCSVSVVYNVIDLLNFSSIANFDSHIFMLIYFMNFAMCYISAYYFLYHGIRQYDMWPKLMDKIKELDQKIKRETNVNNQSVKKAVAAILTIFAFCPFLLIVHNLYGFIHSHYIFLSDILFYIILAQSLINSFVFDVVVYVLYYRFKTLNKLISQLNKSPSASWIALKIGRIRRLHADVCDLVIMVNDIYGLHLLLCAANCFAMVVATLFRIYMVVVKKYYDNIYYYLFINNIVCILYTTQFGLACWICTLACQEFNKTGIIICTIALKYKSVNFDILHETRIQLDLEVQLEDLNSKQSFDCTSNLNYGIIENLLRRDLDRECIRNEINDFSLQLQHRRVAFTACNFFEMSNALFCGFIGMIITYLIISIEFSE
ncbi:uncharacterized protein LOC105828039 isoform X2 [Monomorium pharaonis]|uniref:uncharacterized protein LOC105828039 isoform X2 n=1 Tax=Monomorium pharaonis TaxID=307658 RepID=UPI00063F4F0C|nr:uncharacterized protein LOC105828039 isoform X2 [Monomorium pharaonis]